MGEIIDFRPRNAGEVLFCKYYEQANSIDRWYIRNTLVLNIYGNDYANSSSFERVKYILGEKETRKIMGYCSAWYATRRQKMAKNGKRKHCPYRIFAPFTGKLAAVRPSS